MGSSTDTLKVLMVAVEQYPSSKNVHVPYLAEFKTFLGK